jgi:DNA-nicking Smr family endonuclease
MDDFSDLMKEMGVTPIRKDISDTEKSKNGKQNFGDKVERTKSDIKNNKLKTYKENTKQEIKENEKTDIAESFEEALKLYSFAEDNEKYTKFSKNKKNVRKTIFKNRFSKLTVYDMEHTIDLHGKTLDESERLVKEALFWCYTNNFRYLLIITGKGKHSDNGPVLKIGIKNYLNKVGSIIKEFEYASRSMGGEGAYVVTINL